MYNWIPVCREVGGFGPPSLFFSLSPFPFSERMTYYIDYPMFDLCFFACGHIRDSTINSAPYVPNTGHLVSGEGEPILKSKEVKKCKT